MYAGWIFGRTIETAPSLPARLQGTQKVEDVLLPDVRSALNRLTTALASDSLSRMRLPLRCARIAFPQVRRSSVMEEEEPLAQPTAAPCETPGGRPVPG